MWFSTEKTVICSKATGKTDIKIIAWKLYWKEE
jgi:hypothetical protein